jgi:AcrR family transcriptional regulator
LLDAAETLLADHGFGAPSHRMIAAAAKTHVALVNYHFGTKEMLFEAALERRAGRLSAAWLAALGTVRARGIWNVGHVLEAWWLPFRQMDDEGERSWSNYLCVVARLATAEDGEAWHQRHFGAADREFLRAFAEVLPDTHAEDLDAGFRYARRLFGEILLHRCGKIGGTCRPRGFREEDIDRLIGYLASGMRGMSPRMALVAA